MFILGIESDPLLKIILAWESKCNVRSISYFLWKKKNFPVADIWWWSVTYSIFASWMKRNFFAIFHVTIYFALIVLTPFDKWIIRYKYKKYMQLVYKLQVWLGILLRLRARLLTSWICGPDFERDAQRVWLKIPRSIWWVSTPRRNASSNQRQSIFLRYLAIFDTV